MKATLSGNGLGGKFELSIEADGSDPYTGMRIGIVRDLVAKHLFGTILPTLDGTQAVLRGVEVRAYSGKLPLWSKKAGKFRLSYTFNFPSTSRDDAMCQLIDAELKAALSAAGRKLNGELPPVKTGATPTGPSQPIEFLVTEPPKPTKQKLRNARNDRKKRGFGRR